MWLPFRVFTGKGKLAPQSETRLLGLFLGSDKFARATFLHPAAVQVAVSVEFVKKEVPRNESAREKERVNNLEAHLEEPENQELPTEAEPNLKE